MGLRDRLQITCGFPVELMFDGQTHQLSTGAEIPFVSRAQLLISRPQSSQNPQSAGGVTAEDHSQVEPSDSNINSKQNQGDNHEHWPEFKD